jgi:CheY-like chemotaxis protein
MESKFYKEGLWKFVLIDDDPITCFVCRKTIERVFENLQIVSFTNPEVALEYLLNSDSREAEKTVVFLDLNMPVLHGWDLLKELEKMDERRRTELMIFILSSSLNPDDVVKAKTHPLVLSYFNKPLGQEHLHKVMELTKLMLW